MDERLKRLWAGAEADAYGDGGIAAVERATGMSRTTIRGGRDELRTGARVEDVVNVRRPGGGRPRLEETSPQLVKALESLVDPVTRGDPESPLRWTSKSTRKLASELLAQGLASVLRRSGSCYTPRVTASRQPTRPPKAPRTRIATRSSSSSTSESRSTTHAELP